MFHQIFLILILKVFISGSLTCNFLAYFVCICDRKPCIFVALHRRAIRHARKTFSMSQKHSASNAACQKTPGCSAASGHISQHASQHAFQTVLTHSPLRRGGRVESTEPPTAGLTRSLGTCSKSHTFSFSLKFHATDCSGCMTKRGKAQRYGQALCPSCVHTECNSVYFVRAAAVNTESKKKKGFALQPSCGGWTSLCVKYYTVFIV